MSITMIHTRDDAEIRRLQLMESVLQQLIALCDLNGYAFVAIDLCAASEKLRAQGAVSGADLVHSEQADR